MATKRARKAVSKQAARPKVVIVKKTAVEQLPLVLKGIAELYADDSTRPGLVLSWIEDKKSFYASFARYDGPKKSIIAKAYGQDLEAAISGLLIDWNGRSQSARGLLAAAKCLARAADGMDW